MRLTTCLLISDDPDDHTEFSEAVHEISKGGILLSISSDQRARNLLKAKIIIPDYIFLDISIPDWDVNSLLKFITENRDLNKIPVIIYGGDEDYRNVRSNNFSDFFNRDSGFSELKEFLRRTISGSSET